MADKEKDKSQPKTEATKADGTMPRTRIIFSHGDKGGTGKSVTSRLVADFLNVVGQKVAIVEADTANPDVQRTFTTRQPDNSVFEILPTQMIDLRHEAGWMDMMDFCNRHIGYNIIVNLPGGIGDNLAENLSFLKLFISEVPNMETELWWSLNLTHDAINLLQKALTQYGPFFNKVNVVCNLFWTLDKKEGWEMWQESTLRPRIENQGGKTIYLYSLNRRVTAKLFNPKNIMPFSEAMDAALGERVGLERSERFKLKEFWHNNEPWLAEVFGVRAPLLIEKHPENFAVPV